MVDCVKLKFFNDVHKILRFGNENAAGREQAFYVFCKPDRVWDVRENVRCRYDFSFTVFFQYFFCRTSLLQKSFGC